MSRLKQIQVTTHCWKVYFAGVIEWRCCGKWFSFLFSWFTYQTRKNLPQVKFLIRIKHEYFVWKNGCINFSFVFHQNKSCLLQCTWIGVTYHVVNFWMNCFIFIWTKMFYNLNKILVMWIEYKKLSTIGFQNKYIKKAINQSFFFWFIFVAG